MTLIFYIGTHRLAGLVAETAGGEARVLRFAEIKNAEGFQKGGVAQLEKALGSVGELVKRLELGEEAVEIPAYVLLSSPHLKMTRFSSSIYYPGYPRVVTSREVQQVIEQTRNVAPLPLQDWILQVIPESFWVNDLTGVQDPTGLEAQRLAVTLEIFSTDYSAFRNVSRIFETLEFNVKGYYPKTLLLPEGILNVSEREGEALVIDFSDEATHLVLTRAGRIIQTKSLDWGSRQLSSRVAETWQINLPDAERLKERFGSLEPNPQFGEELIPLVEREGRENHQIKRSEFHEAFLRFGDKLMSRIEKEAKQFLEQEKVSTASLILTGGGAKLEGILETLGRRFSSPIRLGTPRVPGVPSQVLMDPAWAGPLGLLGWIANRTKDDNASLAKENLFERAFLHAKEWLAAYF